MQTPGTSLWRQPEFLKLWSAQTVSFVGSQITTLALPFAAAITLHTSVTEMGFLRFAGVVPSLAVGLFAGVWVDRVRRRPVLIAADIGRACLLGSIPLAALLEILDIRQLYIVAFLASVLTVFFDVAQMSLLPTLVAREQITEGNSKLEVSRSIALIAGPGIAGFLVQLVTAPIAVLVDALSFIGSAVFLAFVRTPEMPPANPSARRSVWADVGEGLRILWRQRLLRTMALSLCVFNFFSNIVNTVYILYLVRELGLAPGIVGLVATLGSFGFALGAAGAGRVAKRFGIGPAIVWGACVSDAAYLLVPLATHPRFVVLPLLVAAQLLATLTGPITAINQLSLRQTITPDRLQGRVNATMRVIAQGMGPLGALIAAAVGAIIGLRPTLVIGVLGLQVGFLILFLSPLRTLREPPPVIAEAPALSA